MRNTSFIALFCTALAGFMLFSQDANAFSRKRHRNRATAVASTDHIQYFGYYAGQSYADEQVDHANVVWVQADWTNALAKARANGMKAVIDTSFMWPGYSTLTDDFETRFEALSAELEPYRDLIIAFSPVDEPHVNALWRGNTATIDATLERWATAVRSRFPEKPRMLYYAGGTVKADMVISPSFDWIGYDCYTNWDDCGGHSVPWYVETLKSKMNPQQKLFLFPDASVANKGSVPDPTEIDTLIQLTNRYYEFAKAEPRVVGLFPFLYWTYNDGQTVWWGTREMPAAMARYREIGKSIKR